MNNDNHQKILEFPNYSNTTFGSHLDVEKDKLDHRKMPSVIEKDNLELSFYI